MNSGRCRDGFTLVEILLAATILGLGLVTLLGALSNCLRVMSMAAEYQQAQWVVSLGELEYPVADDQEIEDLTVDPDTDLAEGYTFEREVEEKEVTSDQEDDGLYVLRTRVKWGAGGPDQTEELVSYVWRKEASP